MARPLRIEFEGAWYHAMNRGSSHCAIFLHDDHREMFLRLLAESVAMFGIEIHSYFLMSNHYHLLIRTPHANLSRAMRRSDLIGYNGEMALCFAVVTNLLLLMQRITWSKSAATFIEIPWKQRSSIMLLNTNGQAILPISLILCPEWLTTSEVLELSGSRKLLDYRQLVENPLLPSLEKYYQGHVSSILRNKSFRSLIMSRAAHINHPEIPESRGSNVLSIGTLIKESAKALNCAPTDLLSSRRAVQIGLVRQPCSLHVVHLGSR